MQQTIEQYHIKMKEQFHHACEISKQYGEIETVLDWCKHEMRGDWRWQLVDISSPAAPGRYIFYMDDDKDYFAFRLKWG